MQFFSTSAVVVFALLSTACGRPDCENKNEIFADYSFESKAYKEELFRQIQLIGIENLRYWVDDYVEKDNGTYLSIQVTGTGLCAKGLLLVTDWNKLKDIRRTKGMGYRGAELVGLQFDIPNELSADDFVYRDVEFVLD